MDFNIDRREILRYLGYKNQVIEDSMLRKIDECRELILREAEYRYTMETYDIEIHSDFIEVKSVDLLLPGSDIRKHLYGCKKVVLLSATLGNKVDKIIKLKERISMEEAIILDACATTLIEEFCDFIEKQVSKENEFITYRYSPGYGDLPIEIQDKFVKTVDSYRKIGLTVTSSNILIPRKSVTAIIGISEENIIKNKKGCEGCKNYEKCMYRKEGGSCEN